MMEKKRFTSDIWFILIAFLISRIVISFLGVELQYNALLRYWQYLDVDTLQHHLLRGVWYDHTQPPFFNLFLGVVLKLTGDHSVYVFPVIFKLFSLANTLLLYSILKKLLPAGKLPLILAMLYLLSPATMVFENELFYTVFISLMFLVSLRFLLKLQDGLNINTVLGFTIPLVIICLTRSMYHLVWLVIILGAAYIYYRNTKGVKTLVACSVLSLLIVGSWYVKNYMIFHSFSTSTWMGMNLARNAFHDTELKDSSKIESLEPFSKISEYKRFLKEDRSGQYAGLNDKDLVSEFKNDSFTNVKHINYIEVSDLYMKASKKNISAHPVAYLKNVIQSSIIFFAPATRYSLTEFQARKIRYYDLVYSFNFSHFAKGKQERRIALVVSAIPKMIIYFIVFFYIIANIIRTRKVSLLNGIILLVIGYIFVISSFFEHYENMRFRYETEPLFILLLAQTIQAFIDRKKKKDTPINQRASI